MTITIILEGPLQAWGDHSKGTFRDTCLFPTKSGIVGMIGAAMGIPRGDERLKEINDAISIAVRADRAGTRMIDYHTVYVAAEDKTEETRREYLQDACFLVAIEGAEEIIDEIRESFMHPVWALYLGRKACIPSRPILPEVYEGSCIEAVKNLPPCERADDKIFYEIESDDG